MKPATHNTINAVGAVVVLLIALALLARAIIAQADQPPGGATPGNLRVYADGQYIGTASGEVLYHPGARELHVTTEEGVIDCRHNVIFRNRFQE